MAEAPTERDQGACHWGGGNDIIWCSTCGAEYAYAKGEQRPPCPRAPAMSPHPGEDPSGASGRSPASAVGSAEAPVNSAVSREEVMPYDRGPAYRVSEGAYVTRPREEVRASGGDPDLTRLTEENAALRAERDAALAQAEGLREAIRLVGEAMRSAEEAEIRREQWRRAHPTIIGAAVSALTPSEEPPHDR